MPKAGLLARLRQWRRALPGLLRIAPPASEQDAAVLRDQANLLSFLCILFAITGSVNCVFVAISFRMLEQPAMMANVGAIILFYGALLLVLRRWRRDGDDLRFLRRAQLCFIGLGTGWGGLINLFALHGEPEQAALILGLASGVVSTPIISVPTGVAFAFFIPDALLSLLAVTFTMPNADPVAATAYGAFALYCVVGILCTNWYFKGRSEARAALQREVATVSLFLREYQEGSPDWLWETDAQGRLRQVAPNLAAATHRSIAELTATPLAGLLRDPPGREAAPGRGLASCLRNRIPFRDLIVTLPRSGPQGELQGGALRWFSLTGHPVYDHAGTLQGFRGIGRDITETREASERIAFMARHDGLTGLLNRKAFVTLIEQYCREGRRFALALIDLDDFKGANDTYGHQAGDALLQWVAAQIRLTLRRGDVAGRLGGDEFAVLLPDLDLDQGHAMGLRLVEALSERCEPGGFSLEPSASLGVAAAPQNGGEAQRLIMLADLALYAAKERGKRSACRFEDWMEQDYRNRLLQEAELSRAISQGEIAVAYQPVVDIGSGQVVAAEALVRWNHPVRGKIMPGAFIPAAERSELIERLGEVVLRLACRDAAAWSSPIQVNVNLSPRQLASGQFVPVLAEALAESGLAPQRLAIEVTETMLLDRAEKTLEQLREIRAMGVRLVLDDFGTGYSSLSYLHDIDVDGIKIDASFIRKLPERKVAAICRMITRLAADLNIYVVAEGVEEPAQLDWLRQNGITFVQGYLLGRPAERPPALRAEYLS